MSRYALLLALGLLLRMAVPAAAATYYVATTGSAANPCTGAGGNNAQNPAFPKPTINAGLTCLSGGDTLLIGNGTYDELLTTYAGFGPTPIPSGSAAAYTILKAQNTGQVMLTMTPFADFRSVIEIAPGAHHIHFEGFVLDGKNHTTDGIALADSDINNLRFKDLLIRYIRAMAVNGGGQNHEFLNVSAHNIALTTAGVHTCPHSTCGFEPSLPTCEGFCHVYYVGGTGHLMDGGTYTDVGGYVYHQPGGASGHVYRNGIIKNAYAVMTGSSSVLMNVTAQEVHHGLYVSAGSTIVHNTITRRTRGDTSNAFVVYQQSGSVPVIKNNLFVDFAADPGLGYIFIDDGSGSNQLPHANVVGNLCDVSQPGCTAAAPGSCFLQDVAGGNLRPCSTSPGRNAVAVNDASVASFTPDQAGFARPQEAARDPGALEFVDAGPVPTAVQFVQQPSTTLVNSVITPAITVRVVDQFGALISSTALITVVIGTNPASGTLAGTLSVNAVAGLATFSTLSITQAGSGYTLAAVSSGLTSATSSAFTITTLAVAPVASMDRRGPLLPLGPLNTTSPVRRSHPVLQGLRHWWRVVRGLDGGTKLWDLVGRAPATLVSMTAAQGWKATLRPGGDGEIRLGGPAGGAGYLSAGTLATATSPFTVALWLTGPVAQPDYTGVIGQVPSLNWEQGWGMYYHSGQFHCWLETWDTQHLATLVPITMPAWRHLTCSWDGSTLALYLNGQLQGTLPTSGGMTTGHPFEIGRLADSMMPWQGSLDDVMVFRRALQPWEVSALMVATQQASGGLLNRLDLTPPPTPLPGPPPLVRRGRGGEVLQ
jgi:Concanavalin A-like lectin/glucanases superfamily